MISPFGAPQVITITDFELSFQFPIKREGASPVVAAGAADSVASIVSSGAAVASGAALSLTAGAGAADSSSLFPAFEITNAPTSRIATRTAKRTFGDPWLFEALEEVAFGAVAAARGAAGAGVVETLTRDELDEEPSEGTGGIITCEALFLTADFFTAFFLVALFLTADFFTDFFAVVFLIVDFFFAAVFFAGDFFAAFLTAHFLAVVFFAVVFFGAAFLAADFFFTATVISFSW